MLKLQNFTDEEIDEAKIFNQYKSGLLFRGRVVCPIVNKAGKIVGFSGRILPEFDDGQSGKYYNTSETRVFKKSRNLFGINYALKHCKESIILCEGNFDVISMHQAGFKNTVAPMGTAFNDDSAREIQNVHPKKIYLSYDSDSAGKKSALKVIPYFESLNIPVFVIDLSPAKDPDELLKTSGAEEMKKRIENAIPSFDFELKMMASGFDLNHPDGRSGLYNSLIERLSKYRDRIKRKEYSDYAASVFHFDKADMLNGVEKYVFDKNLYPDDGGVKKDPVFVPKSASFAMDNSIVPSLMENQTIYFNAILDIKDAHDDIFNEAINYIKLGEIKTPSATASAIFNYIQECIYRGMSQDDILSSAKEDPAFANDAQVLNNIAKIIYYDKYKSIKSYSSGEIRKYLSSLVKNIKKLQIEFEKQNLKDTENKLEIITKLNKELQELKNAEFFGII
jgi:DNA primase